MGQERLIDEVKVQVDGEGEEAILMLHGWPDTPEVWEAQVVYFKENYRCVRVTLPSYDGQGPREKYTIEQIVELIKDVIHQYGIEDKAILMVHDWGAAFGYQFYIRHPEMVSKIVGVDIGDFQTYMDKAPLKTKLMTLAYQLVNVLFWYLGRNGGDKLTRILAKSFKAPGTNETIFSNMNWPYYMFWFAGEHAYKNSFKAFNPSCPFLFIYGEDKPIMFHDQKWAEELGAKENNSTMSFNSDHWLMVREPEHFNNTVSQWLDLLARKGVRT